MNRLRYLLLAVLCAAASCSSNGQPQPVAAETNLRIDRDQIFTSVIINATDTLEMCFDTGCMVPCLVPQSLAAHYADSLTAVQPGTGVPSIEVEGISLGGRSLNSNRIHYTPRQPEAMIAPAYATEERIWCFDFDNLQLSIRETDTLHENAIVYPLLFAKYEDRKIAPFVNIPMTLSCGDRTLHTDYLYMLDTGTPYGFAITDPTAELADFVSHIPHWEIEDRFCAKIPDRELLDFEVDIDLSSVVLPHVRCVFDTGLKSIANQFKSFLPGIGKPIVGTLGMRLLKRFDMILDFKNERLILTPAQRTFPSKPVNRAGFWCDAQGVVNRIRTNDTAYGQGLRLGDAVVAVDGIRWSEISEEQREDIYASEGHSVEIRSAEGVKRIVF